MRMDANVSVRKSGAPYGTRCEIKNLNSLRSLVRAIEYEALRQVELLEDGGVVRQETRHWDENLGETSTLRVKEEAEDYRYFREPDLVDLAPSDEWQARVRAALPPMPAQRRTTLAAKLSDATEQQLDAVTLAVDLDLDSYVLFAHAKGVEMPLALNRATNELAASEVGIVNLSPENFAETLLMEQRGELSATQAKAVLGDILASGGEPKAVAAAKGFEQLSEDSLVETVTGLIEAHADEWGRYRDGDDKLAQFFIGQVMKATKGQANGRAVIEILQARRSS